MTSPATEDALAESFLGCAEDVLGLHDGLLMQEVDAGEGVPDFVVIRVPGWTKEKVREALASLPSTPFLNGAGAVLA